MLPGSISLKYMLRRPGQKKKQQKMKYPPSFPESLSDHQTAEMFHKMGILKIHKTQVLSWLRTNFYIDDFSRFNKFDFFPKNPGKT